MSFFFAYTVCLSDFLSVCVLFVCLWVILPDLNEMMNDDDDDDVMRSTSPTQLGSPSVNLSSTHLCDFKNVTSR